MGFGKNNVKVINPGCNYPIQISNNYIEKARQLFGDSYNQIDRVFIIN